MEWPAEIPDSPGCYLFKDDQGQVLYVGKAKSLRTRLATYRQGRSHGQTVRMLTEAASVEWVLCVSEADALLLEAQLVRSYQPRFNVKLRYSSPYPRLVVTDRDQIPKVELTHDVPDHAVAFGPFTSTKAARALFEDVPAAWGLRTCSNSVLKDHQRRGVPCLLGQIGRCAAPCAPNNGGVTEDVYRDRAEELIALLERPTVTIVDELKTRMREAADALEFEDAARYRNMAAAVSDLLQARPSTGLSGDVDVVAVATDSLAAALTLVRVRNSNVTDIVNVVSDPCATEPVQTLVASVEGSLAQQPVPLIVDEGLVAALDGLRVWQPTAPDRETAASIAWVGRLAKEALHRHQLASLKNLESRAAAVRELTEALDLPAEPLRIECFDISHHSGVDTVSVMVVFEDGVPVRNQYRKFRLTDRTDPAGRPVPDDQASIAEVIDRRYRPTAPELPVGSSGYPVGLVLVDGGPAQVTAAVNALGDLGVVVPVAGLAKRFEEIWLPGRQDPVRLDRSSVALRLCQQLRDEAHRAANDYRIRVAGKRMTVSTLDDVPGLGPKRKARLLAHTGGIEALRNLTAEQLRTVPWLPDKVADAVYEHLHPQHAGSGDPSGS